MHHTIDYYDKNAATFIDHTVSVDFSAAQDRFLSFLEPGAAILDFGCGSGRDTKYFLDRGFLCEAVDGSREMCRFASDYTGIEVRQLLFQELSEHEKYDGIWACASVLHLPKDALREVLLRLREALKPGGYLYLSFKYGTFEGIRNGRYFTDFTEQSFREYVTFVPELVIRECFITEDVRPDRDEEWLNLFLHKE